MALKGNSTGLTSSGALIGLQQPLHRVFCGFRWSLVENNPDPGYLGLGLRLQISNRKFLWKNSGQGVWKMSALTKQSGSNQKMPPGCIVGTVGSIPGTESIAYVSVGPFWFGLLLSCVSFKSPSFVVLNHWRTPLNPYNINLTLHFMLRHQRVGSPAFRSPATTGAPHTVRSGLV